MSVKIFKVATVPIKSCCYFLLRGPRYVEMGSPSMGDSGFIYFWTQSISLNWKTMYFKRIKVATVPLKSCGYF